MKVAKKLYIANIIAYASFMILVAINLEKDSHWCKVDKDWRKKYNRINNT